MLVDLCICQTGQAAGMIQEVPDRLYFQQPCFSLGEVLLQRSAPFLDYLRRDYDQV